MTTPTPLAPLPSDDIQNHQTIDALSHILREGSEPEQCLAAQALGTQPESFDALIEALRDPDPDVRFDVADSLAQLGDRRAIPMLLDNLRDDPVGEIKVAYVKALKKLDAKDATPILNALVVGRGESDGVSWEDEYSEWDDWLDVQLASIDALGTIGSASDATALVAAIRDEDGQDLWAQGTRALAGLGGAGCRALQTLCETAPVLARQRIATSLIAAQSDVARTLLSELCQDSNTDVRIAALHSAAARGDIDLCRIGIEDTSPDVREAAIGIIAAADTKIAGRLIDDIAPKVRIAAYRAISEQGRKRNGLDLSGRVERALRTATPELLAAMVSAMAVAEPDDAGEVLEDIANHPATDPQVRRVALRALANIETKKGLSLLTEAASDKRQDVRLEAIAGLGRISAQKSKRSASALSVLATAIDGSLIEVPDGWQDDDDTIVSLPPRMGRQAAGEDGDTAIKIDREGNIVTKAPEAEDTKDSEQADTAPEVEDEPVVEAPPPPLSTLDAILAPQAQVHVAAESVEIADEDLPFLEMATSRPGKRKVAVDQTVPAHLDVRRLAARIASDTSDESLVLPLTRALGEKDEELAVTAASSLAALGEAGIDISPATPQLLEQAGRSDANTRRLAIAAIGHIPGDATARTIQHAMKDPAGPVRAAALVAASNRSDIEFEMSDIFSDPERRVRLAAARMISNRRDSDAIDTLLDVALADGGVHKQEIANLLVNSGGAAATRLMDRVTSASPQDRLMLLAMARTLMGQRVSTVS